MKFSGSLKRRILYYYVPAKFRSLFSFCCSQRAHNLLSAARPATKLHCCSANRPVSADGSARCEVCLSAAAAGGSLGTPSLRRAVKMKKRNDGRRKEIWKKKGGGVNQDKKKQPLLSQGDSAVQTRKQFVWSSFAPCGVVSTRTSSPSLCWRRASVKDCCQFVKKGIKCFFFFFGRHPSFVKVHA